MKVALIDLVHEEEHPAPAWHPENAVRMKSALNYVLDSDIAGDIDVITPGPADTDIIYQVHDKRYLGLAQEISCGGGGNLDGDTYLAPGSFEAAVETACAAIGAVDLIMDGRYTAIFLAGRPPGHHAERNRGMGFCIINNAAVAAEYLTANHGLQKVAIIDWDVHHGNGTQNIFYSRRDVLYISLHHYPFYPGTGAENETGLGDGENCTLNIPLPGGTGNDTYLRKFEEKIIPKLEDYRPQFIIISCGFDAHRNDPLGGMNLTADAYGLMTRQLADLAAKFSGGRILSLFEGGYDPDANGYCLYNHLKELQQYHE